VPITPSGLDRAIRESDLAFEIVACRVAAAGAADPSGVLPHLAGPGHRVERHRERRGDAGHPGDVHEHGPEQDDRERHVDALLVARAAREAAPRSTASRVKSLAEN
jgi:hypothetical protein